MRVLAEQSSREHQAQHSITQPTTLRHLGILRAHSQHTNFVLTYCALIKRTLNLDGERTASGCNPKNETIKKCIAAADSGKPIAHSVKRFERDDSDDDDDEAGTRQGIRQRRNRGIKKMHLMQKFSCNPFLFPYNGFCRVGNSAGAIIQSEYENTMLQIAPIF